MTRNTPPGFDTELATISGKCAHWRVLLIGNEETGLRAAECEDCGAPLMRRPNASGEFDYFTADES